MVSKTKSGCLWVINMSNILYTFHSSNMVSFGMDYERMN